MQVRTYFGAKSAPFLLLTALAFGAVCAHDQATAGSKSNNQKPHVVVTIKPIHALVSGVMAGVGEPQILIDRAQSPHGYALRPSGARAISKADVFVFVSETVEPFTSKVTGILPKGATVLELIDVEGLKRLQRRTGATFEQHGHDKPADHDGNNDDHDGHDDHAKHDDHDNHDQHADHDKHADHDAHGDDAAIDGHIWLDPNNAKLMVRAIAKTLSERWPEHTDVFQANAEALTERLDSMTAKLEERLTPLSDRRFIVFHDAYQYFEKRFGLSAAGAVTLNPDVPPGARRLSKLRATVKSLNVQCMFAEPQFGDRVLRSVRDGTGARSGILDPIGADLKPGTDLYFNLMQGLADNMRACLAGS